MCLPACRGFAFLLFFFFCFEMRKQFEGHFISFIDLIEFRSIVAWETVTFDSNNTYIRRRYSSDSDMIGRVI